MSVSVAMTTFNGDKYIDEQIKSILIQLDMEDELIISDDGSTDNTVQILKQYSEEYDNIKLHLNNRLGVVKNFEFAIKECTKDIIVLSDQDDIWVDNKLVEIKKHFSKNSNLLILHNAIKFNSDQGNDYGSGELMIKKMRKGLVGLALKTPVFPKVDNKRSMIYIDNLSEFVKQLIDNKSGGLFFPQNAEYVNTSEMVRLISEVHGKRVVMTKLFNPLLRLMNVSTVNKVFGDLVYDMSMSEYENDYRVCGFRESIKKTEQR
jgi:glycosyltransferase involved in cell wall biosynthesis